MLNTKGKPRNFIGCIGHIMEQEKKNLKKRKTTRFIT